MKPIPKVATGACLLLAVGLGALVFRGRTTVRAPNPAEVLTPTQAEDGGSEPVTIPAAPVLRNNATPPGHLALEFGYKVGAIAYTYRLGLAFDADADRGTMDFGVAEGRATASVPVTRRWSESRHAYFVATSHDFADGASSPNLCIRAVLGPSKAALDLAGASLCVMQRDADGRCHPATLACGQVRQGAAS